MVVGLLPLLSACLISTELYHDRIDALTDHDGDGFVREAECDDAAEGVHPGAMETCDGIDQDCDGSIDEDASDARTWFLDADGDGYGGTAGTLTGCAAPEGYAASDGDCDDGDLAVHPGADDAWYDGVDANCDGADDFDADHDGDRALGYGGDCDDQDPNVSSHAEEGWYDAGIDNDCDGDVTDQARVSVDEVGTRIDGSVAGGSFGITLLTVPGGWIDAEPVLLAAAPFTASGDVYGWRAGELGGTPALETASWHVSGSAASDYLGYGMGWAGDEATPLIALGAEGAAGTRGALRVWRGEDWGLAPTFSIAGESEGAFFGGQVISGYDHDGDGIDDLLATAPLDSRVAANAGVAFIFLAPDRVTSDISAEDADVILTNRYAGAVMTATNVGDADGDGLEDLGLTLDVPYPEGPGGLLVTDARRLGIIDAEAESVAQIHGGMFVFGAVWDPDLDGRLTLLGGNITAFDLPISGSVTPWEHGSASIEFEDVGPGIRWLLTDSGDYAEGAAFVAVSATYGGSTGMAAVLRPSWQEGEHIDDAPFFLDGARPGDETGTGISLIDLDGDAAADLALGAPGADQQAAGAGSVWLVRGPS